MINFQDHALLLNESYKHWFGEYLVAEQDPGKVINALNEADLVLLSAGIESVPKFNYGNLKALSMFGCDLSELVKMPLDEGIDPTHIELERGLRAEVQRIGFIDQYTSQWQSTLDKQWQIGGGAMWQLKDTLGRIHGLGICVTECSRVEAS